MLINPRSTYRLQFHKGFTFGAFEKIIPYLDRLGVQTIYASPIFKSVPGSNHGYDVVDPLQVNIEIGNLKQLKKISRDLKKVGMSWLQDIVPNHMAFHPCNEWLMDVLEKGDQSAYASIFDINWQSKVYDGKLMVPFLGVPLEQALNNHEVTIAYENKKLGIKYFSSFYPINPASYITIFECDDKKYLAEFVSQLRAIVEIKGGKNYQKRWQEFITKLGEQQQIVTVIKDCVKSVNADRDLIQKILDQQFYQLCHWKETDNKINYRRFFTVNGLICLNVQDKDVFDRYHKFIGSLVQDGIFQGLRIDHIDGLYDPETYLSRLKESTHGRYIVVEKILQAGEALPQEWKTEGTTGYDFLGLVNNLFTNKNAQELFSGFYEELVNDYSIMPEELLEKKAFILHNYMRGELDNLYQLLLNVVDRRMLSSIYPDDLKQAIGEFLIHCPVYRNYGNKVPFDTLETSAIQNIFFNLVSNGNINSEAADVLRKVLLEVPPNASDEYKSKLLHFYRRCMQFTGPLMAKGFEDTLMYTHNNFIGHNDVGDSPASFGVSKDQFHEAMIERQKKWPLTLNTTSTHDTKRGEDVRARLNVLSDFAGEWFDHVNKWRMINEPLRKNNIPDSNEEYFIYQTLIGAYPMPGCDQGNFADRLKEYLQKALREAKTNSNWTDPNEDYEKVVTDFATDLLRKNSDFWKDFEPFDKKTADFGIINSLAQVLLKFTCPGIPDVYQGCELWDLNFVDPDNRRAVDYTSRLQLLEQLDKQQDRKQLISDLWKSRHNGQIKLWLTQNLLQQRKQQPDFFSRAEYIPLKITGEYADFAFAFCRKHQEKWLLIVVPLHLAELCRQQKTDDIFSIDWKDTNVILPKRLRREGQDAFSDDQIDVSKKLPIQKLFRQIPLALIKVESEESERNAGILLHITSLPSDFAVGDVGPQAYAFADMLSRCNQRIWQVLPLNPVDAAQGFSPYSSVSSAAGNILMISPQLLANENLLDKKELDHFRREAMDRVDFHDAICIKKGILNGVWMRVKSSAPELAAEFEEFALKEAGWLDDFAVYSVIKEMQDNKPWYEWPDELQKKTPDVLQQIRKEKRDELQKTKFFQFLFAKQWSQLKTNCNASGIKLFGDLSFYVSYDSVDVWSHPEFFNIDKSGKLIGAAGTPPDAFSAEGQFWGMPVYNWDALRDSGYKWWIDRIKRSKLLFDLIRLDHFRAFSAYWEIPANQSAKYGCWKPGPGASFFETLKKELGELPFVAEDLGEIDDDVIELRERFSLPGMKVLQFAFDDNMPESEHIPHHYASNFLAYTGTHDNNTTRGWFKQDADESKRNRVRQYTAKGITEDNISEELIRLAYGSVAKTVIIPLQDILNLDAQARMNMPAAPQNNWSWRLLPGQVTPEIENKLKEWVWVFDRM
jgi:malto-oligosyltrehalose synthase/4-alpha-glucanotransferase